LFFESYFQLIALSCEYLTERLLLLFNQRSKKNKENYLLLKKQVKTKKQLAVKLYFFLYSISEEKINFHKNFKDKKQTEVYPTLILNYCFVSLHFSGI